MKNSVIEVRFPNYFVELTLDNDNVIIFSLMFAKDEQFYLERECLNDSYNSKEYTKDIFKEIYLLSDRIILIDKNDNETLLYNKLENVVIHDVPNNNSNSINISGSLCKYNNEVAKLFGLDVSYANKFASVKTLKQ